MVKRGQAAAFIIIGLIILITVAGIIAVKKGILSDLFKKIAGERRLVPQQIKPVQSYLDSCVTRLTEEGSSIMAFQGGYINPPKEAIPTTPFTPLESSLEIIPNSGFRTAVWFREKGNAVQETKVPTITDMEEDLGNYVEANFPACINNLTAFSNEGYNFYADGIPKADVQISKSKISTKLEFPVNVKILDTNFTLKDHIGEVDSNLGKLYTMATEILSKENEHYFLEQKTIDMLVAYNDEVPFAGTDFSCTEKVWLKTNVEHSLKNILFENMAVMHVKDTNYELNNEQFKYLEFEALDTEDDEVTANFMYIPDWPTVIEINPSEGNVLRSDQISKKTGGQAAAIISSFLCLNTYRFVYDIKYPVLIALTDENGLTFQFATQVIIDNNQPRENRLTTLDLSDSTSQICQYPQRQVKIYTTAVDKNEDLVPLKDVSLSFKCFPASCPLGTSKLDSDGEPVFDAVVPLCLNGVIEGTKEGYKQVFKTFFSSNDPNAEPVAVVALEPLYKKKIKILIIDKETGVAREPYSTEQVHFNFIHKQATYQTTYAYPGEEDTIELLPGEYTIDSYLLRNSSTYKITLPKEVIESCVDTRDFGLFGFFKTKQVCQSTETEPIEFDTVLTGGAANVEHEFSREGLAGEGILTLYVLSSPIPGKLEDLQRTQIEIETNKDDPLFRAPELE